jgi:hypothetical protein
MIKSLLENEISYKDIQRYSSWKEEIELQKGKLIRTQEQKFVYQAQIAVFQMIRMRLYTYEKRDEFLLFIKTIKEKSRTMNAAALCVVYLCYSSELRRIHRKEDNLQEWSWEDIVDYMEHPKKNESFSSFVREYGLTTRDLVRYVVYLENQLST